MPTYKIAHIREQGQDMIIFPLDASFGQLNSDDQSQKLGALEYQANNAGLKGIAVAVWDHGSGKMGFFGPREWHPFLSSISLRFVFANLNREISW